MRPGPSFLSHDSSRFWGMASKLKVVYFVDLCATKIAYAHETTIPSGKNNMKPVAFATAATIVATIGGMLMAPGAQAANINVFVTGAANRAYDTLIPQFERASGHKLVNQYALPPELIRKMEAGEPFDVIIL